MTHIAQMLLCVCMNLLCSFGCVKVSLLGRCAPLNTEDMHKIWLCRVVMSCRLRAQFQCIWYDLPCAQVYQNLSATASSSFRFTELRRLLLAGDQHSYLPIDVMADDGGPTKAMPLSWHICAKPAFSDRKPYPGCMAVAPACWATCEGQQAYGQEMACKVREKKFLPLRGSDKSMAVWHQQIYIYLKVIYIYVFRDFMKQGEAISTHGCCA